MFGNNEKEKVEEIVIVYWLDGTKETFTNSELYDNGLNCETQWVIETKNSMVYIPFSAVKKLEHYSEDK